MYAIGNRWEQVLGQVKFSQSDKLAERAWKGLKSILIERYLLEVTQLPDAIRKSFNPVLIQTSSFKLA